MNLSVDMEFRTWFSDLLTWSGAHGLLIVDMQLHTWFIVLSVTWSFKHGLRHFLLRRIIRWVSGETELRKSWRTSIYTVIKLRIQSELNREETFFFLQREVCAILSFHCWDFVGGRVYRFENTELKTHSVLLFIALYGAIVRAQADSLRFIVELNLFVVVVSFVRTGLFYCAGILLRTVQI